MLAKILGSTGSIASPGPGHVRFGGNTSSVLMTAESGQQVLLDAGTGIRGVGPGLVERGPVHVVFTHLHIDHVVGLGFFAPLFMEEAEVHLWGPPGATTFRAQLDEFFSPPLFPVLLDRVPAQLTVHDLEPGSFQLPGFAMTAQPLAHPGPTVGLRVEADGRSLVYVPDHEPGVDHGAPAGDVAARRLCVGADVLIHDVMYFDDEYPRRIGFGHSSVSLATTFLESVSGVGRLLPFHQAPEYDDEARDRLVDQIADRLREVDVFPALEGFTVQV